jgi:hypothetical protein
MLTNLVHFLVASHDISMKSNCFFADYLGFMIISCSRCSFLSFYMQLPLV